jgi:pimeloyl-ACP methyl ester carboxylesterase
MTRIETVQTADGRSLAFAQWGDPEGSPLVNIHGTPGCRLNRHPKESVIADLGVRMITYDRPGYGQSSRHRGRIVNDCVADVTTILDSLGIETFAVSGGSGGGPHCLAVAAAMPDRVTRAGCIVGLAPFDVLGQEAFYAGMDPENIKEFGWALDGEDRLWQEVPREANAMLERMAADPTTILGDFELPEADKAILARADIQELMREAMTETFANGPAGWIDDDLAFTVPWGFDPSTITVPTTIWWGAHDVLVPAAHGEWLAKTVPGAIPRVDASGGHQADPDTFVQALYPWLTRG